MPPPPSRRRDTAGVERLRDPGVRSDPAGHDADDDRRSPALLTSRNGIREPDDVLQFPLLHLNDRRDWSRWLEAAGGSAEGMLLHGPIFSHASMLIDAAIDGQGVALLRTALAAADLINGRLVRPFRVALRLSNTYWIVCPKAMRSLPKIVAFRDWVLVEAAADARKLAAVPNISKPAGQVLAA
jgi:DNA-binding transcriptional LysR family regulator